MKEPKVKIPQVFQNLLQVSNLIKTTDQPHANELLEMFDQVFKEKIDAWCGGSAKKLEGAKRTAKRDKK